MHSATRRDIALQAAIAALFLLPLLAAFWGGGGVDDAFTSPLASQQSSRVSILLAETGRSLLVGGLTVLIAAAVGIPAAWWLASRPLSAWRTAAVILPFAFPAPVAVSGWVQLAAPSAASSFALQLPGSSGMVNAGHALLFSPIGAAVVLGFGLWPIAAVYAWPGFLRARDEAYESALLSTTRTGAFFRTVLPRCKGHVAAGLALVFLFACNDFAVSSLLLVKTLPVEIHDQTALGKNAAAAWAALPLLVLTGLVCVALTLQRIQSPPSGFSRQTAVPRSGRAGAYVAFLGVAIGFLIPMLACLRGVMSSGKPMSPAFDAGAESLVLSARLAAAAALIGCLIAFGRTLIWPEKRAGVLNASSLFLLAIPGSMIAAAFLTIQIETQHSVKFLNHPLVWLASAFALRFLFIPLRLIDESVASIDPQVLDSAAILGQSRFRRALSVTLPLSMGHLAAAAAVVFTLCLGEVAIAATLAPPGSVPATIWLFNQQHMGYDESVFALSLLLGGVAALAAGLGAWGAKLASR